MKKDLDRKERAVPPGIEIPGIPARKLVKAKTLGNWFPRGFLFVLSCLKNYVILL